MLPCLNCKQTVQPQEAKVFAGVYVCPSCFSISERLYQRGEQEIRHLLTMMKESIRVALLDGRVNFKEQKVEEVSKTDVLRAIVKMEEERVRKP